MNKFFMAKSTGQLGHSNKRTEFSEKKEGGAIETCEIKKSLPWANAALLLRGAFSGFQLLSVSVN